MAREERESPTLVWEVVGLMVLVVAFILWANHYNPNKKNEQAVSHEQKQENQNESKAVNVEE